MDVSVLLSKFFSLGGLFYFVCGFLIAFCFFSARIKNESEERREDPLWKWLKVIGIPIIFGIFVNLIFALKFI